jgi:hypothetical protein
MKRRSSYGRQTVGNAAVHGLVTIATRFSCKAASGICHPEFSGPGRSSDKSRKWGDWELQGGSVTNILGTKEKFIGKSVLLGGFLD